MTGEISKEPTTVPCDHCGSDSNEPFLRVSDLDESSNRDLVKCLECGLIFISPRKIKNYEDMDGEALYFDAHENLDVFSYFYDIVAKWASPPGRFLDVGCGAGYLLNAARVHGWETTGVDLWKELIHVGRRYLKLDIKEGTLFDCRFEAGYFDVAVMTEFIEHTPSPYKLLVEINRILKAGGIIFLTTPNIASTTYNRLGEKWLPQIHPAEHLFYFTKSTMNKTLEKAGFEALDIFTVGGEDSDEQLMAIASKKGDRDNARKAMEIHMSRRNAARYKRLKRHWFFSIFIKLGNRMINYPADAKTLKMEGIDAKRYERLAANWFFGPIIRLGDAAVHPPSGKSNFGGTDGL